MNEHDTDQISLDGSFVTINDERFYKIENLEQMPPFFISVISNNDHWLFISSNGALTAGRESSETALFPYECVDKIYDDYLNTGSRTLLRVFQNNKVAKWEPFNEEQMGMYTTQRNLYKSTLGNKICFEEINHDLSILFRYYWEMSDKFGFIRRSEIINLDDAPADIEVLDGLQNILPAGTPKFTQTVSSNLVDAYKWSELLPSSTLALYTLYSGITDRAEPCEALRASTVFSLGLNKPKILLSSNQLSLFKRGGCVSQEQDKRGIRGAYFINARFTLAPDEQKSWMIVANTEQTQAQVSQLQGLLGNEFSIHTDILSTIAKGDKQLASIMAASDGFQATNEENVSVHHYANTLFNVLRGGIFNDQYNIESEDLAKTIKLFNLSVYNKHKNFLSSLEPKISLFDLHAHIAEIADPQLERLCIEYLPIFFGRRHGDPSRPWNQFSIKLKDKDGAPLLSYEGNWRDIFQNWEALSYSFPEYIEGMISKFVNASTVDGYNPYRITKEGIDWEVEEEDDPWSYIGYWGDHQIIYLLKLLEMSRDFHPSRLQEMLQKPIFCYANVPYRIKHFEAILENAKDTVEFDNALAEKIEARTQTIGADGKLLLNHEGEVYQVTLLEKLLVPLLSKLGNLVIDGGIWLNTQRPEWNDANNALVGQGLSMVTLNYLRRYVSFMQDLLKDIPSSVELSAEVAHWLDETSSILSSIRPLLNKGPLSPEKRFESLSRLGQSASNFRIKVYAQEGFSNSCGYDTQNIQTLLGHALQAIDHTIHQSEEKDGLYQAYNLLLIDGQTAKVDTLYPMLEGQVAALSSGLLAPEKSIDIVNALYNSAVYRADQKTFMLYPDREQTRFMDKNLLSKDALHAITSLGAMLEKQEQKILVQSEGGQYRFNADLVNKNELNTRLNALEADFPQIAEERDLILKLYEDTFDHQSFTGRSGGMFGFEGLGSVYWHMVSKLLLALAENYTRALEQGLETRALQDIGKLYYRVREGIGFNKTPGEYGAFPTDPYSHTPKHAGAQQPGMTGQVKEELVARFTELGIHVRHGEVKISPSLLRRQEFITEARDFWYLDTHNEWQCISLEANTLAFTWCQVPFIYRLGESEPETHIKDLEGKVQSHKGMGLDATQARALFTRDKSIKQVEVFVPSNMLFSDTSMEN